MIEATYLYSSLTMISVRGVIGAYLERETHKCTCTHGISNLKLVEDHFAILPAQLSGIISDSQECGGTHSHFGSIN